MNREDIKQIMLLAMSEHHSGNANEALRIVDQQLAALEAAGVRLVPVRITPEMAVCLESNFAVCEPASALHAANWQSAYKAALAASPYVKDNGNG